MPTGAPSWTMFEIPNIITCVLLALYVLCNALGLSLVSEPIITIPFLCLLGAQVFFFLVLGKVGTPSPTKLLGPDVYGPQGCFRIVLDTIIGNVPVYVLLDPWLTLPRRLLFSTPIELGTIGHRVVIGNIYVANVVIVNSPPSRPTRLSNHHPPHNPAIQYFVPNTT